MKSGVIGKANVYRCAAFLVHGCETDCTVSKLTPLLILKFSQPSQNSAPRTVNEHRFDTQSQETNHRFQVLRDFGKIYLVHR